MTIHGDLVDFTDGAAVRQVAAAGGRSVKDLIESVGVPHPEVMRITANDAEVGFDYPVTDGDRIAAFPGDDPVDVTRESRLGRPLLDEPRFLADVHLGRLVRYLRLLGLDCYYEEPWDDAILAETCARENRIMLTRDRGLLKRRCIDHGFFLRSDQPLEQAQEVLGRLDLARFIAPFSRCVACSRRLQAVRKEDIADRIPPGTRRNYERFYQCEGCGKVYWRGAHYGKLQEQLDELMKDLPAAEDT